MSPIKENGYDRAAELWVKHVHQLWKQGQHLIVHFLDEKVPPTWVNARGGYITEDEILEIANEWHQCGVELGQNVVPKFVKCEGDDVPDIQVKYGRF